MSDKLKQEATLNLSTVISSLKALTEMLSDKNLTPEKAQEVNSKIFDAKDSLAKSMKVSQQEGL